MVASLAQGDYALVLAIESTSRHNIWYRVLRNRTSSLLSCDCPTWIFNRRGNRTCDHTECIERIFASPFYIFPDTQLHMGQPLFHLLHDRWPGLHGTWQVAETHLRHGDRTYHLVVLHLYLPDGSRAAGLVAFSECHHHSYEEMFTPLVDWAGYAIAAELAWRAGATLEDPAPAHFHTAARGRPEREHRIRVERTATFGTLLHVGDRLRAESNPALVAEQLLASVLGADRYAALEEQGYLDVQSRTHTNRVYRLRRDPAKLRDRRIRVFEGGSYTHDFCLQRGQPCPEADFYLTNFLGLLSDEDRHLAVMDAFSNVFSPYSDNEEIEEHPPTFTAP